MRSLASFGIAVGVWLAAAPALAEVYKWTDKNGAIHYTSDINQVPASQRDLARAATSSGKGSLQRIAPNEEQLRSARNGAASSEPTSTAAPAPAARVEDERVEGKTEAQWRADLQGLRSRIAQLEPMVERCEGEHFDWSAGDGGRKYREESAEAAACSRTQSDLQVARLQLEKLEERARVAGVPPGWMREP